MRTQTLTSSFSWPETSPKALPFLPLKYLSNPSSLRNLSSEPYYFSLGLQQLPSNWYRCLQSSTFLSLLHGAVPFIFPKKKKKVDHVFTVFKAINDFPLLMGKSSYSLTLYYNSITIQVQSVFSPLCKCFSYPGCSLLERTVNFFDLVSV